MIDALMTGKLIRDPALKTGPSGKPFSTFLLSVPIADGDPVVVSGIAFGDVAEQIARLKKGDALSATGSLKPSEWTDKTTGEIKHGLNITVSAALSAYDVKKRRGNASNSDGNKPPQTPQDYSSYAPYDDAVGF